MLHILAVDDEPDALRYLVQVLGPEHEVTTHTSATEALRDLGRRPFDLVLADLTMPPPDGFEVLRRAQQLARPVPVIVISAMDCARAAIEALRLGARDFVVKPAGADEVRAAVMRVAVSLGLVAGGPECTYGLAGRSAAIREVRRMMPLLARVSESVLIVGETGTGKELLAHALHEHSPRRERPFVAHNMAATPADLAESIFFGHVRGAFSGATADHRGLFEQADGGTLFLDEVDSFPLGLQAKLLRVLESGCIQRVGSSGEHLVDVRIVAASSVALADRVAEGSFRADLFYRLSQLDVFLPPLRERMEDIPDLVEQFLAEINAKTGYRLDVSPAALSVMLAYPWPGNCRELRHAVRASALLAAPASILPSHLPVAVRAAAKTASQRIGTPSLQDVERIHIMQVLESAGGNQSVAARVLGIDRGTLARKLKAFGVG